MQVRTRNMQYLITTVQVQVQYITDRRRDRIHTLEQSQNSDTFDED